MLKYYRHSAWRGLHLRVEKVISSSENFKKLKAIEVTAHLTGDERVSMLEDLRREASRITGNEYPRRLRRILEVLKKPQN